MSNRHLASVGVVVDLGKRVGKTEEPGTDEMKNHAAKQVNPGQPRPERMSTLASMPICVDDHQQDGEGFQGREDSANPQPVPRSAQPVIVMSCSRDPGEKEEA